MRAWIRFWRQSVFSKRSSDLSLLEWIVNSITLLIGIGLLHFYVLAHLVLRVPMLKVWEPFGIISGPTLLFGPLMYWGNRRGRGVWVCGIYLLLLVTDYTHYAMKYGLIDVEYPALLYAIDTLMIATGTLGAYYSLSKAKAGAMQ